MNKLQIVQPEGWPRPRGYSNGMMGRGRTLCVAGQIGWDEAGNLVGSDFVSQFRQALSNVVAVVRAAGGEPSDIARLTIYTSAIDQYRRDHKQVGAVYRQVLGKHFPTMALLGINELVEPGALVEIEATAFVEDA